MANSTKAPKPRKPKTPPKPRPNFPLFAHQSGRWCKKYGKTKFRFYGRWAHTQGGKLVPVDDIDASASAAETEFDRCWKWHSQGEDAPPVDAEPAAEGFTIADLANRFLNSKKNLVDGGERSVHTFSEYHRICATIVKHFGADRIVNSLRPDDFESLGLKLKAGCNLVTLRSKINRARVVFGYAHKNHYIGITTKRCPSSRPGS